MMDEIEATAARVLKHAMLVAKTGDRRPQEDPDEALGDLRDVVEGSLGILRECMRQAQTYGVEAVHAAMHRSVVDHEMLDEAAEYARKDEDEG